MREVLLALVPAVLASFYYFRMDTIISISTTGKDQASLKSTTDEALLPLMTWQTKQIAIQVTTLTIYMP